MPREAPPAAGEPGVARAPPGTVRLALAGDVHFEGALEGLLDDPAATLGPFSRQLHAADLAMVNPETAVATAGAPASKELEDPGLRYWFGTRPAALEVLARSGVDVASVANNPGAAGLRSTLALREDSPVAFIGAGTDAREAFAPYRTASRWPSPYD